MILAAASMPRVASTDSLGGMGGGTSGPDAEAATNRAADYAGMAVRDCCCHLTSHSTCQNDPRLDSTSLLLPVPAFCRQHKNVIASIILILQPLRAQVHDPPSADGGGGTTREPSGSIGGDGHSHSSHATPGFGALPNQHRPEAFPSAAMPSCWHVRPVKHRQPEFHLDSSSMASRSFPFLAATPIHVNCSCDLVT